MNQVELPDTQNYPMLSERLETPFVQELFSNQRMLVNGNPMPTAVWNLIVSKRDITMWCKFGMKPHRGWKISQVKNYFGLKGNKEKLLTQFEALFDEVEKTRNP